MQTNARALAIAVWPESINEAVKTVVLVVAGTAILALSAKIQVPFWPVPMTLQTFAVMALAAAYGSRLAVATAVLYLVEGIAGVPVFAGGSAGPGYILGPTGGFLLAFPIGAAIVGFAADRGWDRDPVKLGGAMLAADAAIFAIGLAWLAGSVAALDTWPKLFQAGLQPFILADALKIVLAALFVPACWGLVGKR